MSNAYPHSRLPRNFHKTFKPERQYIGAMLRFAASGQEGDYQTISEITGIPTGASSGKVPAILDYCRGMGLLTLEGGARGAVKKPQLTPFGRMVLLEDPFLKEAITQWIAHFNLCSPKTGADVWYQVFFKAARALGTSFKRVDIEQQLSLVYEIQGGNLLGPLIGTYEDEAAFAECGALKERKGLLVRATAPVQREFGFGIGAWILQLMQDHFPGSTQVTLVELDEAAGWRTIPGWDMPTRNRLLQILEQKALVDIDRQMEPWLLRAKISPHDAWAQIYDDLI